MNLVDYINAVFQLARQVVDLIANITYIRDTVWEKESMRFEELFSPESSTPEIVTTFQALLELLKHQFVLVEQEELFSTITIKKNPNRSEEEDIGEIDEYN